MNIEQPSRFTDAVRAKKANSSKQSTRFFRLSDVREKLESLVDVKVAEDCDAAPAAI